MEKSRNKVADRSMVHPLTSKNELEMGVTYHFLFTETRGRMQMAVLPSDA